MRPPIREIDGLPFLDAIFKETLRRHSSSPGQKRRVCPAGGAFLCGHVISQGIIVSTNAYTLHRDKEIFPEPSDVEAGSTAVCRRKSSAYSYGELLGIWRWE